MKITLDIIIDSFHKLNKLYFDNKLPGILIKLSRSRTQLGCFSVSTKSDGRGNIVSRNRSISISTMFDRTLQEYENTLAHEMIHYAIHLFGPHDETSHGNTFCRYRDLINSRGLHHIEISTAIKSEEREPLFRRNYIIVSQLTDGTIGITVVASTRIFEMDRVFRQWDVVKSHRWWGSTDQFFNKFPRVTKPKIYPLTKDEYEKYILNNAIPLEIKGNHILPA